MERDALITRQVTSLNHNPKSKASRQRDSVYWLGDFVLGSRKNACGLMQSLAGVERRREDRNRVTVWLPLQ